jgi:large subunit ribosomal protein L17
MLRNLTLGLLRTDGGAEDAENPGRIITTPQKAKACRGVVERLVTLGKKGGVANFRRALAILGDKAMTHKLFREIAPRYADRQGGYTRILHLAETRRGDAAAQCIFELVEKESHSQRSSKSRKSTRKTRAAASRKQESPEDEGEQAMATGEVEDTGGGDEKA